MKTVSRPVRVVAVLTTLAWAWADPVPGAYEAYIKFDGVDGESLDPEHRDWVEALSFGYDLKRNATYGSPGSERSNLGDLRILKYVDKASPKLFLACVSGQELSSATLELCRAYGEVSAESVYFMRIELSDVIVSSVTTGGGDPLPTEEVTLSYGKIKWIYMVRDQETGVPLATVVESWDGHIPNFGFSVFGVSTFGTSVFGASSPTAS